MSTSTYFSGAFWVDALERTVRAFAWSAIGVLTADKTDIIHASFQGGLITVGITTAIAFLGAIAGTAIGDSGSASFVLPAPKAGPVDPAETNLPAGS